MSAVLFVYDIPEVNGQPSFPNPSPLLRSRGFRINLSCWVMLERDLPYELMNEMTRNRVEYHVAKFDASEAENLARMASVALQKEVEECIRRTQDACDRATLRLNESNSSPSIESLRAHRTAVARNVKGLRQTVTQLREAAKRFGVDGTVKSLNGAIDRVRAIQTGMHTRARQYVEVMTAARRVVRGSETGEALVQAVERDSSVMPILADYLDDYANDDSIRKTAAKARSLFDSL